MKIGFLVERNIYFRIFGSIIDKALERGHQVFCFHNYSHHQTGSKGYQFPDIAQTPPFKNGKVVSLPFQNQEEIVKHCLERNIKVIVSLDFMKNYLALQEKLQKEAVKWCALQSGFDSGPNSGEYLSLPDRFFIYSPQWLQWIFAYLKKSGKTAENNFADFAQKLNNKVKAVGFWLTEQKNIISAQEVKHKWGIPPEKKVVLFLPFPFGSSVKTFWTQCVFGWRKKFLQLPLALLYGKKRWIKQVLNEENDYRLCCAIKKFCEKNNAYFLVKSRQKDPVKNYLAKMADKVLYDEEFYPATILQCFSVADICLSFFSSAVLEAATTNVPHICIAPAVEDWKDIQGTLWQIILEKERNFFDFPGVSYLRTIPDIINNLAQQNLGDFPLVRGKQVQYTQKFANGMEHMACEKILLEVEKVVEKD